MCWLPSSLFFAVDLNESVRKGAKMRGASHRYFMVHEAPMTWVEKTPPVGRPPLSPTGARRCR
jgi:hypothetical protein